MDAKEFSGNLNSWNWNKTYQLRSCFEDLPVTEDFTPADDNGYTPGPFASSSLSAQAAAVTPTPPPPPRPPPPPPYRCYSPLPDLIIERVPETNKHDEPDEFYEKLEKKVKNIIKKLRDGDSDIDFDHCSSTSLESFGDQENNDQSRASSNSVTNEDHVQTTITVQAIIHREDKVNSDVDAETAHILSPILPSTSYARKKSKGKNSTVSEEGCEADDKSGDDDNDSPHQHRRQHIHPEEDIMRSEAPIRQSNSITKQYYNIFDDNIHHKSASPIVETAEMEEHQSTDGSEKSLLNASFIGSVADDSVVEEISEGIAAQKGTEVECERQTSEASDEEHENDVEDEGLEVHADVSHLEECVHLHRGYRPALHTIFEETTLKDDETNKDDNQIEEEINQNVSIRSRRQNPKTVGSVDALVEDHDDASKNHTNISGYASVAVQTEDRAEVQRNKSCKRRPEKGDNIEVSAKKSKNNDWEVLNRGFFPEKPTVYNLFADFTSADDNGYTPGPSASSSLSAQAETVTPTPPPPPRPPPLLPYRLYSPLPDLIIERVPKTSKHDEPEEFFEKLEEKVKNIIKRLSDGDRDIDFDHCSSTSLESFGDQENTDQSRASSNSVTNEDHVQTTITVQAIIHREDKVNSDVDAETAHILSPILPSTSYARKKSKGKNSTVSEEGCEADDKSGDDDNDSPHQHGRQHIHPEEDIMRSEAPIRQSNSITKQYNNIFDENIHHKSASPIVETAEMEGDQSTDGSEKSLLNASLKGIGSVTDDSEVEEISDRIAAQKRTEVECDRQTGEASDEEHENDVDDEGPEVYADLSHLEESVHQHHGNRPALDTIFEETTLKDDETNKDDNQIEEDINQNNSIRSKKQNPETVGSVDALVENHDDASKNYTNISGYASVAVQTEVSEYASVAVQTEVSNASVAVQTEVSGYASVAVQTEVSNASVAVQTEVSNASVAVQTEVSNASVAVQTEVSEYASVAVQTEVSNASVAVQTEVSNASVAVQTEVDNASVAVQTEVSNASVAVQTEVSEYSSVAVQTEVSEYASVAVQTEVIGYASVAVQTEDRAEVQRNNSCKRRPEGEDNIEDSAKKSKNSDWEVLNRGFFLEKPMVYTLCKCKDHVCKKS